MTWVAAWSGLQLIAGASDGYPRAGAWELEGEAQGRWVLGPQVPASRANTSALSAAGQCLEGSAPCENGGQCVLYSNGKAACV